MSVCHWLARALEKVDEPSAAALLQDELIVWAVRGLQERIAAGVSIDVEGFRAGLLALAAGTPGTHT